MTPQLSSALKRCAIMITVASLLAGQGYFLGNVDGRLTIAAIFGAAAAAITRAFEGVYDAHRQSTGDVREGDVSIY